MHLCMLHFGSELQYQTSAQTKTKLSFTAHRMWEASNLDAISNIASTYIPSYACMHSMRTIFSG